MFFKSAIRSYTAKKYLLGCLCVVGTSVLYTLVDDNCKRETLKGPDPQTFWWPKKDDYLQMVIADMNKLDTVPKKYLTEDFYYQILEKDCTAIELLPQHLLTQDMYDKIIKMTTAHLFKHVPDQFKSDDLCNRSVIYDNTNMKYVPESKSRKITADIINDLIKHGYDDIYWSVSDSLISPESWLLLIKNDHNKIKYLPRDKLNYQFIKPLSNESDFLKIVRYYIKYEISWQLANLNGLVPLEFPDYLENNDLIGELPEDIFSQLTPNDFENMIITGLQFKKYFGKMQLTKITNSTGVHNEFKFVNGLNTDTEKFYHDKTCYGGLYFTNDKIKGLWSDLYHCNYIKCHLHDVEILDDSIIKIEKDKFKTNKFSLTNHREWKY